MRLIVAFIAITIGYCTTEDICNFEAGKIIPFENA
jgi:hypothetical protein